MECHEEKGVDRGGGAARDEAGEEAEEAKKEVRVDKMRREPRRS